MKKKWKLCVTAGAIMVFAVFGTLILAQNVMSSAEGSGMEFQLAEEKEKTLVSESAISEDRQVQEDDKDDEVLSDGKAASQDTGEMSSVSIGFTKEKSSLGECIVFYAKAFQGVKYVYGGTDLPEPKSWTFSIEGTEKNVGEEDLDLYYYDADDVEENTWQEKYGVDCSGLVMKVFEKFDIKLPRTVKEQSQQGTEVKIKDIKPGDIIFYGTSNAKITHCGIYAGDDKVIHVSARTEVVKLSDMNYRRIAKVVRVIEE